DATPGSAQRLPAGPAAQPAGSRGPGGLPPVSGRGGTGENTPPQPTRIVSLTTDTITIELNGITHTFHHTTSRTGTWLGRHGDTWHVRNHDPVTARGNAAGTHAGTLTAPMPGTVTLVKAAVGEKVTAGQSLLVVEAMKMEHVISAPHDGTVTELDVTAGATVAMDQVLAVVTPQEES
ncbi:biotin/lipoyl-containing protein, partial [Streptomyces sp. ISL-11]|uniref:acetyl-CoA carboxylase biotin carboxyl carrier protein subunit n=1 Tax=Streptomyces sp. ISL-11 TaxID=2819174 RepID=UPI001C1A0D8B